MPGNLNLLIYLYLYLFYDELSFEKKKNDRKTYMKYFLEDVGKKSWPLGSDVETTTNKSKHYLLLDKLHKTIFHLLRNVISYRVISRNSLSRNFINQFGFIMNLRMEEMLIAMKNA